VRVASSAGAAAATCVVASFVGTAHGAAVASDCASPSVRSALASFVTAFNRGDAEQLDVLFTQPPQFQWYSSNAPGLRRAQAAKNRAGLLAYFRARHLERDRLRLASFTFTGNSPGYGNFVFRMKRSAADYRKGAWFGSIGKGSAVCSDLPGDQPVRFIVVSLGGPGSDRR
jgi:hypothetical protein